MEIITRSKYSAKRYVYGTAEKRGSRLIRGSCEFQRNRCRDIADCSQNRSTDPCDILYRLYPADILKELQSWHLSDTISVYHGLVWKFSGYEKGTVIMTSMTVHSSGVTILRFRRLSPCMVGHFEFKHSSRLANQIVEKESHRRGWPTRLKPPPTLQAPSAMCRNISLLYRLQ